MNCAICQKPLVIPEARVHVRLLAQPLHADCAREYAEARQRRYAVIEATATGYPLRYEVQS